MIIPPEIHRWFHSTHPSVSVDALNDPNVTVLGDSIPFSFGLSIFDDDCVVVIAFTEQGIAGLLVNDTDDALNWAEEQYERVKQKADPIPLHGGIQEPTQQ